MKIFEKRIMENLEIIKGNLITELSYDMYEDERQDKITGLEGYNYTSKVEWKTIEGASTNFKGRIFAGCMDLILELAGTKSLHSSFIPNSFLKNKLVY